MSQSNKEIPISLQNIEKWQMSRRHFVKGLLIAGVVTQIPFLSACLNEDKKEQRLPFGILNSNQRTCLKEVQSILFPSDGNGPSASDINALDYLQWVISDSRMDPSEVKYLINGVAWLEESSEENFSQSFLNLSQSNKEKLVAKISKESWGESWLSVILTLIFEALLSDPQYQGNTNSVGWKWLNHNPGNPRPTKDLLYDKVFETINS
jgi:hypothetical protein